jgi:hypothetical protein
MTMSNKSQTAVSWLIDEIECRGLVTKELRLSFEQAKALEKNQIINAVDGFPIDKRNLNGLDYYNETYGEK